MLSLNMGAFWISYRLGRSPGGPSRVMRVMVASSVTLCLLGMIQLATFATGIASFGIGDLQHGFTRLAIIPAGGMNILRMSALGGEPKHFAGSLLPVLAMLLAGLLTGSEAPASRKPLRYLVLVAVCFVLTFSTSSFYGFLVFVPLAFWALRRQLRITFPRVVVLGLVLLFLFALHSLNPAVAGDVFETRVSGRVGEVDNPEAVALAFLSDNPSYLVFGVGWGNIGFYGRPYLRSTEAYLSRNVLPLSSFSLRILSETGIVGLFLLMWFQVSVAADGLREIRLCADHKLKSTLIGLVTAAIAVVSLQPFNSSSFQWVIWGALCAANATAQLRRLGR
jgi:hypothetical protein